MKKAAIIGAGISGATCARLLAEKDYAVTVFEGRQCVGGLCHDGYDKDNLYFQSYGPHIFHTDNKEVNAFIHRFAEWKNHTHSVLANLSDGTLLPVPFNFESLSIAFEKDKADHYIELLNKRFVGRNSIQLDELLGEEFEELKQYIITHIFEKYTAKQWGKPITKINKSVINRIPIKLTYENSYFTDKYQYMPQNTFSEFIIELLRHPNINIQLATKKSYDEFDNSYDIKILTGPIDYFFKCCYGSLDYRSVDFDIIKTNYKQKAAVINYTETGKFTRITNFSMLKDEDTEINNTCIEYPKRSNELYNAYYPDKLDEFTTRILLSYKKLAAELGFLLCGRLACYKYFDIDDAILNAIDLVKGIEE